MPLLNVPRLDLSTAQETTAFRAVDKVLRHDSVARTVFGRNIYSWLGDALDDAKPTLDRCPWLRLTPAPEASAWGNVEQHRMPMSVGIEIACAGTNVDNLMNLHGVVRAALFPQDAAQRAIVTAIIDGSQIMKPEFTKPAYGVVADDKGNKMLYAMGSLSLILYINT